MSRTRTFAVAALSLGLAATAPLGLASRSDFEANWDLANATRRSAVSSTP